MDLRGARKVTPSVETSTFPLASIRTRCVLLVPSVSAANSWCQSCASLPAMSRKTAPSDARAPVLLLVIWMSGWAARLWTCRSLATVASGCAGTRVYYTAEDGECFILKRTFEVTIPWDSLVLVRNGEGLDLVVHPYEPAAGGDDKLFLGVCNRSKGVKVLLEETELIDGSGTVHWPLAEQMDSIRAFEIQCPEGDKELRAKVGAAFRCETRLAYSDLDLEGRVRFTVRFAYRPAGVRSMKHTEIKLVRHIAVY